MNLPVLSVVTVYSLADGTRLVGLLLEDLQRVGKAAEDAALRLGVASHRERIEDEVSEGFSPQSLVVSFRCLHSLGRLVGHPAGQVEIHMKAVGIPNLKASSSSRRIRLMLASFALTASATT